MAEPSGPAGTATEPIADEERAGAAERTAAPPERGTIVDAVTDLVQLLVDYVRQETGDIYREKVVLPTQKVGQVLAFALAAAAIIVLGIVYISVGAMILLAEFVGWPVALFIIGGVLVLVAGGLTYAKTRSLQS